MNFVLRTKKKNLVALRPIQRLFPAKTVFIRTHPRNFFLTPKSNEQILHAAVNLVLNAYKTISPEPCCFRKLFGGFSTFCALARPSTCKHSRVGREPGRACAGTRSGSAGTEDFLTRRRERACAGTRTGSAAAEDFRAARRPHANKPHSRRLRACYLQLTQAGQRTKPDSTRRLPRGRPLPKRCHIFCSAWNNTTASAVSFLSQLHHGNKSRPIVLVQAFGAMQKQLVKTHLSKKLFNQQASLN